MPCHYLVTRSTMAHNGRGFHFMPVPDSGECLISGEPCDGLKDPCEHEKKFIWSDE